MKRNIRNVALLTLLSTLVVLFQNFGIVNPGGQKVFVGTLLVNPIESDTSEGEHFLKFIETGSQKTYRLIWPARLEMPPSFSVTSGELLGTVFGSEVTVQNWTPYPITAVAFQTEAEVDTNVPFDVEVKIISFPGFNNKCTIQAATEQLQFVSDYYASMSRGAQKILFSKIETVDLPVAPAFLLGNGKCDFTDFDVGTLAPNSTKPQLFIVPWAHCTTIFGFSFPGAFGPANGVPSGTSIMSDRCQFFREEFADNIKTIATHEIGHSLGLGHMQLDNAIYRDRTDPMGEVGLQSPAGLNAVHLAQKKWIKRSEIQEIGIAGDGQTHVFTLNLLEGQERSLKAGSLEITDDPKVKKLWMAYRDPSLKNHYSKKRGPYVQLIFSASLADLKVSKPLGAEKHAGLELYAGEIATGNGYSVEVLETTPTTARISVVNSTLTCAPVTLPKLSFGSQLVGNENNSVVTGGLKIAVPPDRSSDTRCGRVKSRFIIRGGSYSINIDQNTNPTNSSKLSLSIRGDTERKYSYVSLLPSDKLKTDLNVTQNFSTLPWLIMQTSISPAGKFYGGNFFSSAGARFSCPIVRYPERTQPPEDIFNMTISNNQISGYVCRRGLVGPLSVFLNDNKIMETPTTATGTLQGSPACCSETDRFSFSTAVSEGSTLKLKIKNPVSGSETQVACATLGAFGKVQRCP